MSEHRRGIVFGALAYGLWGVFPLYWTQLEPAGALEILAHRILWSAVTMVVLVVLLGRTPQFRALWRDRRTLSLLTFAAVAVSINWLTYIWAVNNGRVIETSLGYFINPLITVLMGVLILGERLRRLQWAALTVAALAVVLLTFDYGRLPWVSLVLAFSFGSYGLAKKRADAGAVESVTLESLIMLPVAASYIVWLMATGQSQFGGHGEWHTLLFLTTGLVTAIPLMLFGAAATRVSLVTLGLLQYLAPTIQFALGILVFHEPMPPGRLFGFGLVWLALALFTFEALHHRRSQLRLIARASAM